MRKKKVKARATSTPAKEMLLNINEAAFKLNKSIATLKRWELMGKLKPKRDKKNGYRKYTLKQIESALNKINTGQWK